MESNATIVESLLERATEYGKTTYELTKLKVLEKSSDLISTAAPHILVASLIVSFLLLLNIGASLWIGELVGQIYAGFFIVAAFYLIMALMLHFIFHKSIKRKVCNYILKQVLK